MYVKFVTEICTQLLALIISKWFLPTSCLIVYSRNRSMLRFTWDPWRKGLICMSAEGQNWFPEISWDLSMNHLLFHNVCSVNVDSIKQSVGVHMH